MFNHFPQPSPLERAIKANQIDEVKQLLDAKANPNELCGAFCGSTLLCEAVRHDRPEIVRLLLIAKADPKKHSYSDEQPPISYVRSPAVLKTLIEAKENPLLEQSCGRTLMHHVAGLTSTQSVEMMQILLDHKASISVRDKVGETPLLCAVEAGNNEGIEFLLKHRASLYEKTDDGSSIFDAAKRLEFPPFPSSDSHLKFCNTTKLLEKKIKSQQAVATLAGLHRRAGAQSVFTQAAARSTHFEPQTLRLVLKLAGAKISEQANRRKRKR